MAVVTFHFTGFMSWAFTAENEAASTSINIVIAFLIVVIGLNIDKLILCYSTERINHTALLIRGSANIAIFLPTTPLLHRQITPHMINFKKFRMNHPRRADVFPL
jgi:hypothetical protein